MQQNYKIADHTVQINSMYDDVHLLCQKYRTDEQPEYYIEITPEDIEFEKDALEKEMYAEDLPVQNFSDGEFESSAVYRKIVEKLFDFDILLCHGSAVAVDERVYMFIAKSGTGKSTHARMWRELLGSRAVMVNDDKPLVKVSESQSLVYGTPWNGKHRLGNNIVVPLSGICILRRGTENRIRQISLAEAYPMLLQQIYRIPNKLKLKRTMELIDIMCKSVKLYVMECNISTEAAEMAYQFMSKGDFTK